MELPSPRAGNAVDSEPLHLLVDSTGLKLCGAGEWLVEKHVTRKRRSWRKSHIGADADTGKIVAATLTTKEVDDASEVGSLLEQVAGPLASFTADGACDQDSVYDAVTARDPEAADTEPAQRDRHLQCVVGKGRMGWQKASGCNVRSRVEAAVGRYKQVIGDGLRFRKDERRATEVAVAVRALNCVLELGRPISVRIK